MFTAASQRFQTWQLSPTTGLPTRQGDLGLSAMSLTWGADAHAFLPFQDVDAPPGITNVVAMSGNNGVGLVVFDTSDKRRPSILYQDHGPGNPPLREAKGVYATTINSRHYALVATGGIGGGLHAYDLSAAQQLTNRCTEGQPGTTRCAGVYLRQLGNRTKTQFVDGVADLVVVSSGTDPYGFEIYDLRNPATWGSQPPQLRMEGLTSETVFGVAMWQDQDAGTTKTYLAVRTLTQGRIYDVSCVENGYCQLGSALSSFNLPFAIPSKVTFSRSGNTPFLYFAHGTEQPCSPAGGRENLFNVENPAGPVDISPTFEVNIQGENISYWEWYNKSAGSIHGFNHIQPRVGKFAGDYFYRAAKGILDVHRRTGGSAPSPKFSWSPSQTYPGSNISFTDLSTGGANSWDWTFDPDGSPGSSTARHPSGISFSTPGTKSVTLEVSNDFGPDSLTQNLTVLSPDVQAGSVSVSPNPAFLCQPVTFTATGFTGQPTLSYDWDLRDGGNNLVTGAVANGNQLTWDTTDVDTGTIYTATVTVSNGVPSSDSASSAPLIIVPLPALPTAGSFLPTYDGAPAPIFEGDLVQFQVTASGATSWRWDFGDGFGAWSDDPINGPAPLHIFDSAGPHTVRVEVDNCALGGPISSASLQLDIQGEPPNVDSFQVAGGAFCSGLGCSADVGSMLTFSQTFSGATPDFYEYDWDNNGTFEESSLNPVSSHTYGANGSYQPQVRVRTEFASNSMQLAAPVSLGGGSDIDPPATPGNPTAMTVPGNVEVTWNTVSGATGYNVYRALGPLAAGNVYGVVANLGNTSSYTDNTAADGVEYCYMITAANDGGESAPTTASCSTAEPLDSIFGDDFEANSLDAWGVVN